MSFICGLLIVVVAGACNALFALPMKKMTLWKWENQWGLWSVWALGIFPWIIALLTVPDLASVYGQVDSEVLWKTWLLGLGGGVGMVTFGFGLYLVGFSLGFSIILGLTAATGSLVPLLLSRPSDLLTPNGYVLLAGLAVTVLGVSLCGKAGIIREKGQQRSGKAAEQAGSGGKFWLGLVVCITSAIFNAMINLSFTAGAPIAEVARQGLAGETAAFRATNAVWAIGMSGALWPNVLYCGYLLTKGGTWRSFKAPGTRSYWLGGMVMGLVWMGGYALYGISTALLGEHGVTAGWILFFAVTVLVGNLMGFWTGEWNDAPREARRTMKLGVGMLLLSILIIGIGGTVLGNG